MRQGGKMEKEIKILENLIKFYLDEDKSIRKPDEARMMNHVVWNYYKQTNKIMNAKLYDIANANVKDKFYSIKRNEYGFPIVSKKPPKKI